MKVITPKLAQGEKMQAQFMYWEKKAGIQHNK